MVTKRTVKIFTTILLLLSIAVSLTAIWLSSAAKSELRAYAAADAFIADNHIGKLDRRTCAYDSDNDGYGTCTLVIDGEPILLQCPSGFLNTLPIIGASSCKEVPNQILKLGGIPKK
jgi:hypothetical protein